MGMGELNVIAFNVMGHRQMKLKHAMVLAFLFVAIIPFVLGLQAIQTYTAGQYRAQMENQLSALSQIAKQRILSAIERVEDSTALLESRTQLRLSLRAWNETGDSEHTDRIQRILDDARTGMDRLLSVVVYAPDGELVVASSAKGQAGALPAMPEGKPVIGLIQGADTRMYSVARLELDSTTVGFMAVTFTADFLTELVQDRSGLGTTGEWLFAVRTPEGDALLAVPSKYDRAAAFVRKVPANRLDIPMTQALLGNEISMRDAPDYRGVPVYAATRYLPAQDWGLVAKMDVAEVDAMIDQANRFLMWLVLGVIFLAILFGFAVSHYIARPVEQLRADTNKLSHGDFDIQPLKNGWYEVKELSLSFSNMAAAIKDLSDHLNTKVAERTQELNEANQKLHEIAIRDPLTNLYNRRFLRERFKEELERAKRYGHGLAVVMADIDHFKKVNDTYGHDVGDQILTSVATCMSHTMRDSDIVSRFGGEEFCIVMPMAEADSTIKVLERLRERIAGLKHPVRDADLSMTCSFGVTMLSGREQDMDHLLKEADDALYRAKGGGRNCVVLYGGDDA